MDEDHSFGTPPGWGLLCKVAGKATVKLREFKDPQLSERQAS